MIFVESFDRLRHMVYVQEFSSGWGAYVPTAEEMPEVGFVVSDLEKPIAMAFLRRLEGNYAQLDGLLTDPEAPAPLRNRAVDTVVQKSIDIAKELGLKGLVALSKDENTLKRSEKFGFLKSPETVIFLDLSPQAQPCHKES